MSYQSAHLLMNLPCTMMYVYPEIDSTTAEIDSTTADSPFSSFTCISMKQYTNKEEFAHLTSVHMVPHA